MTLRVTALTAVSARGVGAAAHRAAALEAVAFLIDWLKTRAPFWKRELFQDGASRWVDARVADDKAAARW